MSTPDLFQISGLGGHVSYSGSVYICVERKLSITSEVEFHPKDLR